jgi:hypothetical protein
LGRQDAPLDALLPPGARHDQRLMIRDVASRFLPAVSPVMSGVLSWSSEM